MSARNPEKWMGKIASFSSVPGDQKSERYIGEVVMTPFMGVGSEVWGAYINGRKGLGIELKTAYYRQAVRNMEEAVKSGRKGQQELLKV